MPPTPPAEPDVEGASKESPGETDPLLGGKANAGCCFSDWTFGLHGWMGNLCRHVGWRLLVVLFFVEHLLRGFVAEFAGQATPYIYASYSVPAPRMQIFEGITQLPWAMKPIVGLLSDVVPIRGYHKGPYMVMASILGPTSFLAVGALSQSALPVLLFVACVFFSQTQLSVNDILAEAKYAEKIRELPEQGPSILTYVWFGMSALGLLGVLLSGISINFFGAKFNYLVCTFPAVLAITPVAMGYLGEQPVTAEQLSKVRQRFYEQKEMCFLSVLMFVAIIALIFCSFVTGSVMANGILAIVIFIVMLVCISVVLSPTNAMFNAWSIIQSSLTLSTGSASFYFMTDTLEQYPEGPHFSEFFYTSVLGTVGSVLSLVGIMTYERFLSRYSYRYLLVITNVVVSCLNFLDIIFYTRKNVEWGIPDHAFVLGTSVLSNIIGQWQWMPQVIILSYLCPKRMEATMYALLAGCHNLGNTVASSGGALLLDRLGVAPNGSHSESAQFKNLWVASLIASVLPLITTVALVKLVPDVKQGDPVMADDVDATDGSLWRQWQASRASRQ